jgi:hypothetical protein
MFQLRNAVSRFIIWAAEHFGFELDLHDKLIVDSYDEKEVFEQLQFGRD